MSLRDAVLWCFTSMNKAVTPINDYQAAEFAKHSVKRRDPMMITMITMLEVESFPTTCVCQRTRPCLDHVPWPSPRRHLVILAHCTGLASRCRHQIRHFHLCKVQRSGF